MMLHLLRSCVQRIIEDVMSITVGDIHCFYARLMGATRKMGASYEANSLVAIEKLYVWRSPSYIYWLLPNVQWSSCKVLWYVCSLCKCVMMKNISAFLTLLTSRLSNYTRNITVSMGYLSPWIACTPLGKIVQSMAGITQKRERNVRFNRGAWSIVRSSSMALACILQLCWVAEWSEHSESVTIAGVVGWRNIHRMESREACLSHLKLLETCFIIYSYLLTKSTPHTHDLSKASNYHWQMPKSVTTLFGRRHQGKTSNSGPSK